MTEPRIGFDALFLEQPMTGVGQYALNLWRQLRDQQQEVLPQLLLPADAPAHARAESRDGATASAAPPPKLPGGRARKMWWEQTGVVLATRRASVDLVHIPHFSAPLYQAVPHVVTVHDVIPLALPGYGGTIKMRAYLRLVARTVRRAPLILTDSEHARRDITRHLGIPPERIRVTPLAAGEHLCPAATEADRASVDATRARHGLHIPFVLYVGGLDIRKRLPQLIRGFAAALPLLPETYDLVIPGRAHTDNPVIYPPLEPLIRELGIADRVRLIGFVSEEDKRDLYRAASVFVFASEYEGFGLNPLEAMACGAPVICSNRSSLLEVVGDAGLLIDPEPDAIARALVHVLTDDALRADLARRGLRRAATFSWNRTMRLTLSAYHDVLDGKLK
ncbi:MAG: glycosyltransferase family 1 protein [Thermomicrobiales bacterium]